jgi:hypothetical protein
MDSAITGSLNALLISVADRNEWAEAALDVLVRHGMTDAPIRMTPSRETVLAIYSVRRALSIDTNRTMSECIAEMLKLVESVNEEALALHAVPHEASNHEILVFTDLAMRRVLGLVPIPRQTA